MLNALPPELIAKIFQCLLDSPRDYRNLSRTCKSICAIASQFTERTALSFNFNLDLECYSGISCDSHGQCPDLASIVEAGCEQQLAVKQGLINSMKLPNESCEELKNLNAPLSCYYHRIYGMLHAKFTTFSTMRFVDACLSDPGCAMALGTSPQSHKLMAMAELELASCVIKLEWLATMLKYLKNLKYLTLRSTHFEDRSESDWNASIKLDNKDRSVLRALRIISHMNQVSDCDFKFFIENCPAIELDLAIHRIEQHPLVLQRFYGRNRSDSDIWTWPSNQILSFNMVYFYLSEHKNVLKSFRADETSFMSQNLRKILDESQDLHMSCRADYVRNLDKFRRHLSAKDLERLEFVCTTSRGDIY